MYTKKQLEFTHPIGSEFNHFNVRIKVVETERPECYGCYFYNPQAKKSTLPNGVEDCTKIFAIVGNCDCQLRTDKKNVIFKLC